MKLDILPYMDQKFLEKSKGNVSLINKGEARIHPWRPRGSQLGQG